MPNHDRVRVSVNEGVAAFHDPSLIYELDYGLDSVTVVIGDGDPYYSFHRDLELRGELDHAFTDAEIRRLRQQVKIFRAPPSSSLAPGK